jgi:immune inhibitor A
MARRTQRASFRLDPEELRQRCCVAPSPALRERMVQRLRELSEARDINFGGPIVVQPQKRPGFNDGLIVPGSEYPLGTPAHVVRSAAATRAPLRGTVRVIVVLAEFDDAPMKATPAHFRDLFFSTGKIPTGSVREYYTEVTHGFLTLAGEVVGPYKLPRTLKEYAGGKSGTDNPEPNARTMARDAANLANADVNFAPYDNDGNGFVDAFIVVHAGAGAEETGDKNEIWSHKWVFTGQPLVADGTKIYGYLTIPENSKIGVCAHELGHLLFGWPDLYDTDGSSEGLGNWCLMGGGSWNGGGDIPAHPSAWCKVNQGWATVVTRKTNARVTIKDVKSSHRVQRLWKNGAPGKEYFLVENRQRTLYDRQLPGEGLLVYHVDESIDGNDDENHPMVKLLEADGRNQLRDGANRGDAGDPFPGSTRNVALANTTTPNSQSYGKLDSCVAISGIPQSSASMTVTMRVKCPASSTPNARRRKKTPARRPARKSQKRRRR